MSANVETMFYAREAPWHGLGVRVADALSSKEALEKSGLNWTVLQKPITTSPFGSLISGYKANVRDTDSKVLGIVTDRYQVVQNEEAFAFTDALLGEGVKYETAGSLAGGKRIWILAKLPEKYIMSGDAISPYMVFTSSHDGNGSIKVAMTPIRVVCQNTLNLALSTAKRSWATVHVGDLAAKMDEAHNTLLLAEQYMNKLGGEFNRLSKIKLSDQTVLDFIDLLLPMENEESSIHRNNVRRSREDMKSRYFDAPDLKGLDKNGYRFINAVSDFATHAQPARTTANYKENVFAKTLDGHPLIDKAHELILAA